MMTRTLPRAATIWGAALILATAGSPRIAAAVNICDCLVSQITYPSGKNFPQPCHRGTSVTTRSPSSSTSARGRSPAAPRSN